MIGACGANIRLPLLSVKVRTYCSSLYGSVLVEGTGNRYGTWYGTGTGTVCLQCTGRECSACALFSFLFWEFGMGNEQ